MGEAAALRMVNSSVGFLGTEIEHLNAFTARTLPFDSNSRGSIFGEKAALQNLSKNLGVHGVHPDFATDLGACALW